MKLHSLRLKLIFRFVLIVLAVIAVISISANLLIGHQFEQYVMNQQDLQARELAELARAVNQMAENLERQEALRKRLTADVAHELRTPLANVSSYMEMMIEGVWEPTPERLQSCYDELQRLSGLVSDLERLRQVENGNLNLKKTEIDLLALAQGAAGQFEGFAAQNGQRLTVEGEHTLCLADRDRIMQVITNLLSNAVSYTGQGGSIRLLVEDSPEAAVLRVQDNGPGIAAQDMPLIFERFYRADKSRSRKNGGAGIGLTIAKAITDAHGGEISVESEEGRGSCFTLTLPKE